MRVHKAINGVAFGRVRWIEHLGDANHLHLRVGDTSAESDLVTLTDPATPLAVGDAVDVEFIAPLYFDAQGRRIAG